MRTVQAGPGTYHKAAVTFAKAVASPAASGSASLLSLPADILARVMEFAPDALPALLCCCRALHRCRNNASVRALLDQLLYLRSHALTVHRYPTWSDELGDDYGVELSQSGFQCVLERDWAQLSIVLDRLSEELSHEWLYTQPMPRVMAEAMGRPRYSTLLHELARADAPLATVLPIVARAPHLAWVRDCAGQRPVDLASRALHFALHPRLYGQARFDAARVRELEAAEAVLHAMMRANENFGHAIAKNDMV